MTVSAVGAGSFASRTVQAINIPGMFGEVIADLITRTWPDSWRPAYFGSSPPGLFAWRGLIFPLYCAPFWWFIGLGVDAFRGDRRLHWAVFLVGTVFAIFFLIISIGLAATFEMRDYQDMAFVFVGLFPWTVLFALFPITWWRNFRRARKLRQLAETLSTPEPT